MRPPFRFAAIALSAQHRAAETAPAKQDDDAEPTSAPVPAAPEAEPAAGNAGVPGSTGGTIPDIITPPGEGRETECAPVAADTAERPVRRPGMAPVAADIGLRFHRPRIDRPRTGGKQDPVVSGAAVGSFTQPSGKTVSPFGAESYEPAFTGTSYAFAAGRCTITTTLDIICPWGTNAGGRTDIASGTSPVITAANWAAIKADLAPAATTPFKSPRTTYYSQSLVERHEKFHGTDDQGWTGGSGLGFVKASLEAGSVTAGSGAAAAVTALVSGARTKLVAENGKWYKGAGTTHDAFDGEIRAYADGKSAYQTLADAVEVRGKALAAAAARPATPPPVPTASRAPPPPPPPGP